MKKLPLLCRILGHSIESSSPEQWMEDKTNFICRRCGTRFKRFADAVKYKRSTPPTEEN